MAEKVHEIAGKLTPFCRKIVHVNIKWRIIERVSIFGDFFRFLWRKIVSCSSIIEKPILYRQIVHRISSTAGDIFDGDDDTATEHTVSTRRFGSGSDSDLVSLKISLLGDCQTGKTTFVIKYVGDENQGFLEMTGLNLMDKTFYVQGVTISFSIWDVGGDEKRSKDHIPIACKDAVAILFMFDLTSRSTLNRVFGWYSQARKWNKTAIPILIGTKFDDFVRLPPNLQWTIVTQARAYAKVMKASLFFSSATHNINVNKIFKFILAKLFNLPWKIDRNLTLGEPIIDYDS
ncbi:GTP-binding family protein [Arabidopsis lyrata subsp. lyrata]|uniref:GTP-binding family protein n=1 Tax=Arabidopsis lyrata subsp. lyrata TaxID=81972 RepID=D7MUW9_ARALL|nr:septum-promoting GTP-binding protein 1 isoform X2 [Arabidopsis lyrata subsp. lyrata]EFH42322.1 GTP-binding family protein [Arabidopsis lyrata subsp. lyrata]|eukprot:XP_020871990.1 septum-promoting GTP-binding protein 1 isoform X2 [Arabidopsis lyrata subsp. lyrata]